MEKSKISVQISGIIDIMFDKFIDHSKEVRPADQKLYLSEDNKIVMPTENLNSFLVGDKVPGCAKIFEGKTSGDYIRMIQTHLTFKDHFIPFRRKGKVIKFNGFDGKQFWIHQASPITKGRAGVVKHPIKDRPCLATPWELQFEMTLFKNSIVDENKLHNYFDRGGILISLGTYRPRFGRFVVDKWNVESV